MFSKCWVTRGFRWDMFTPGLRACAGDGIVHLGARNCKPPQSRGLDGSEAMMTKLPTALLDRLHASVKATNDACSKAGDVGKSEEPVL
jgi:hypothetical protein